MKIKPTSDYVDEQGPILEDGERYPATLKGFGEFEGQYGKQLVWQFVVDDDGESVEAAGFTSYSMANGEKKSNLIKYSEALLGELPDEFDLDDLIGKSCRVDVSNYTSSTRKTEDGTPIVKNKVTKVLPPKKGQKASKEDVDLNEKDFEDIPF